MVFLEKSKKPRKRRTGYFLQSLGGEKLLQRCRSNIFKRPERGLRISDHVSDRFSDIFRVFQIIFRVN